ncbi:hypothetical protein Bca52824_037176 [Brassica carinata]|uniref:HTH OST-type domain-containing protein n=1 Tax=Brassica carinata TaxID=52824 RepID=A0A8X7V3B5_BRACI|nr:hypothetical protein Bca52824_037176 [Brassica carinata]
MRFRSLPSKSLLFRLSLLPPRRFNTSSFSTATGSASVSNLSSPRRHHHDEDSRSVRVAVWWDFNKCNLPATANVFKLAQSITGAIRNSGIKGPITITAFGDVLNLPRSNQEALSSTGITLTHVPQGGKNSADRSLITDLMCWVSQNPPPAHVFLISTDEAFAGVLHRLRMSNYNVLLSSKSSSSAPAPGVLCSAASIMWDWEGLVKGDNGVTAKYFNQPPDGPYNSWYGHYRVPLLDPFSTTTSEVVSEFSSSSVKARVVPKEVVDKIRVVLSLFPKGLSVSELRSELIKSNVAIDKDYYGHKSFARFLQSMPDVFQVNRASDGLFVVRAVAEKAIPKRLDSNPGLSSSAVDEKINEKVSANASTPKLMTDVELGGDRKGRDISFEKKHEIDKDVKEKAPESSQESILVNQKDVKADDKAVETNQVSLIAGVKIPWKMGFQKLKRMWSGSPEMESEHPPENKNASGSGDKEEGVVNDGKAEDKDLKSSSQGTDSLSQISPSFAGESSEDVKTGTGEAGNSDKNASPGVFSQLLKSFKFWERNKGLSDDSSGNQKLVQVDDIFANESSWSDVESFIHSPRGYIIVSHSRTREMIAKNLQREGPSCLKQLDESSMLHLVTLLISHKKWIEENPSSSPPFSIIKGCDTSHGHASNGLISIFSDCAKPQDGGEKRFKNVAHAGVSVGYKSNALADCQKLIKKMTEKSPEGYSLIRFRKDFLEEYGYHLAVEKLGYKNLQSLVQVMPGVRISSGYVLPSTSGGESTKEDESDSSFEELGPVSEAASNHQTMTKRFQDSGSERDIPRKKKKKQVMSENDKDSSLLQILDSYYKSNGEVKMEQPVERKLVNNVRKPKPSKTYSFVKDSEVQ